jgi:hypothetical protein
LSGFEVEGGKVDFCDSWGRKNRLFPWEYICFFLSKKLFYNIKLVPWRRASEGLFSSHANPKYFLFHPSHQIFGHMHEVLNVGKKITNCTVCL